MKNSKRTDIHLSASDRRGIYSEERVAEALNRLAERGEIHCYEPSERYEQLDEMGIDFLVWPEPSWIIALQVKSSLGGLREHRGKAGVRIPCVVVHPNLSDAELDEILLTEMGLSKSVLLKPDSRDSKPLQRPLETHLAQALGQVSKVLTKKERRKFNRRNPSPAA